MDQGDVERLNEALSAPGHLQTWAEIRARYKDDPARMIDKLIPRAIVDPQDPYKPPPHPEALDKLRAGAAVLIELSKDPRRVLDNDQLEALEFLSHIAGRPAIPVNADGSYAEPPPQWKLLDDHEAAIRTRVASVGRIDAPAGAQIGTAFVVKKGIVLTNRHVAQDIEPLLGKAVIDFGRTLGGASTPLPIHKIEWMSTDDAIDAALLRIDEATCPASLFAQPTAPAKLDGTVVYAVGYPGTDNEGKTPEDVLRAVFRQALGIKRVQPGLINRADPNDPRRFRHDCSTLGGSSGSCVIVLDQQIVYGLHYSGKYEKRNTAVGLWALVEVAPIKKHIEWNL